jgi:ADP-ribose pyrophosphatase YjhB (NUDIX family)
MQTISQAGISYSSDKYDVEGFREILEIAAEIAEENSNMPKQAFLTIFREENGYVTPKVDVRGAVFQNDKVLLVREIADANKWTLPGGWADIGISPSENVAKEVLEETGLRVNAVKLAAAFDRSRHAATQHQFYIYKLFFICKVLGGALAPGLETSEVRWFSEDALPDEEQMSDGRARRYQILRMFEHCRYPELPADFD